MKYRAIVMVPTLMEFTSEGDDGHITDQANKLCTQHRKIVVGDLEYIPKLMSVVPVEKGPKAPLYFDPPPMCA